MEPTNGARHSEGKPKTWFSRRLRLISRTLGRHRQEIFTPAIECPVVDWHRFTPSDFEYDFEHDKLAEHDVRFDEAVECFFSDFQIRRNKKYRDR